MTKNKKELAEKLDEVLGTPKVRVLMPKEFLANLREVLVQQSKEILVALEKKSNTDIISELQKQQIMTRELFGELERAIKTERVNKVEVLNFPQKEIEIKKPKWYERFIPDTILEYIKAGFEFNKKSFESALDRHKEKENAFAVRLVDAEGKSFYTAMYQALFGGINAAGLASEDTLTAIKNAVEIMDDWDQTDRAKVNAQLRDSSDAALDLTTGGQTGLKVHVVGDGDKYVRGVTARDAAVGSLEPVVIGGRGSTAAPTAVSTDGDVVDLWLDLNGRLRVTGDASMTALKVDGSAVTQPVSGTITETNSAAIKTAVELIDNFISGARGLVTEDNSAAIKAAVETIDNAIAGTEMQVDVVASLPAGTNAIGKLAANSGVDIGDVDVTSATASSFDHGRNSSVTTTASQVTTSSIVAKFGIRIVAALANTDVIYVGNSDVTADSADATDGFPLQAGESMFLPVNNANIPYVRAASGTQKVFFAVV